MQGPSARPPALNMADHNAILAAKEVFTPTSQELIDGDQLSDKVDYHDQYHSHLRGSRSDNGFTKNDRTDMRRMGKQQELRRDFRALSALAFTVILQGSWEVLLVASTQGLVAGGVAGLFWSYIWTYAGMALVVLSLAEMASMAPTSGGQYHWVSEFAPPKHQKLLSYFTGWMSVMSWQAGAASGPFLVGTMIQSLVFVNKESYEATNWQGTLMVWGITFIVYLGNVYGGRAMPVFQNVMLIVHVFAFLAIIVMFWVLAPRNTASVVFTQFTDGGGWPSMGLALMVGQITALYACICSDAAAHMSEEIKDAGRAVPTAMIGSYVLSGVLSLVFLISYLFVIVDIDGAINHPTGYPFLYVFEQAFSMEAVNALTSIVIVLIFAGTLSYNLSSSRQVWAFARDEGLPFSRWIAKVDPSLEVPRNAVVLTAVLILLLSLINIGSDVAFNAIISLNLVCLMFTYMVSISCVLYRRIYYPALLPKCQWSLGKWGVTVNTGALLYSTYAFFWSFWPNEVGMTVESFNWSSVMFIATVVISVADYMIRARHVYKGPVVYSEAWKEK